jgi:hypothetical protein
VEEARGVTASVARLALLLALAMPAVAAAAEPEAPASTPATPAAPEIPPRKDVAPLVKQVFETGFEFCTNPGYPLTREELKWCDLMSKSSDARCPQLSKACSRGATAELVGQRSHKPTTTISMPTAQLPVRLLFWIVLGAVAAFLIYTIAKQTLGQRATDKEEAVEVITEAPEDPAAAMARIVETDVQRLLERARASAARGDYEAGIGDAYAALLRKLEGSGVVTVESHRTNGDHVRDVGRQHPAMRPRMQAVVGNVEEVQFGGGAPTDARFRSVMLDVMGLLSERLAGWLPFLVKVGLGLTLTGAIAGCRVDRESWDRSPTGRAGVLDLLQRSGFTARERLVSLTKVDKSVAALVVLPGAKVEIATWKAIANWTADGGCLVIAGGTRDLPAWIGATPSTGSMSQLTGGPLTVPPDQSKRLPPLHAVVPEGRFVKIATPETSGTGGMTGSEPLNEAGDEEDAPAAPIVVRGKSPYAVERTFEGGGRVIVIADDRLFENASLLVEDNARLLVELLRPGGKKLELAGELTGLVSKNPITSVQRGNLAPGMLQLWLLILLFFLYKGAHFGRPIDPAAASRRAFSEHARALGLLYGRARAGRHALEAYGGYALDRMRERLNLSGGKGLIAVAEEVATRVGRPLGDVMRVLVESRPTKRSDDPVRDRAEQEVNSAKDLATLRDLATLLQHATTGGAGERIRSQRQT